MIADPDLKALAGELQAIRQRVERLRVGLAIPHAERMISAIDATLGDVLIGTQLKDEELKEGEV